MDPVASPVEAPADPMQPVEGFLAYDLRVGTVVAARVNAGARVPALVLTLDFGPLGKRTTSGQLTRRYDPETLVGRQVVAVVNFPPKRIAGVRSEVLVLGGLPGEGDVVLLAPDAPVPNGTRIG
ncbi:MAG: tRNA-binding protein [Thermaerobacter sp.]|nr:tRNA-binding protein [Thermaerobacter sp.]